MCRAAMQEDAVVVQCARCLLLLQLRVCTFTCMITLSEFIRCYVHGMPKHGSLKRVTASLQRISRLPACVQALQGVYTV